jgi:hypothetical protein
MAEGLYGDLSVGLQIFATRLQVELARLCDDVLPTLLHEGLHQQVRTSTGARPGDDFMCSPDFSTRVCTSGSDLDRRFRPEIQSKTQSKA